jgi:hypothetical protein
VNQTSNKVRLTMESNLHTEQGTHHKHPAWFGLFLGEYTHGIITQVKKENIRKFPFMWAPHYI